MKRLLTITMAVALVGAAAVPSAQAATCGTSCLRTKVTTLTRQEKSLATTVANLEGTVGSLQGTVGSQGALLTTATNNITTLHNQVVSDEGTLMADNAYVGKLQACLLELPITDYNGYAYDYTDANTGTGPWIDTTAIDVTESGGQVGAWVMADQCALNSSPTNPNIRSHVARPGALAPSFLLTPFAK